MESFVSFDLLLVLTLLSEKAEVISTDCVESTGRPHLQLPNGRASVQSLFISGIGPPLLPATVTSVSQFQQGRPNEILYSEAWGMTLIYLESRNKLMNEDYEEYERLLPDCTLIMLKGDS